MSTLTEMRDAVRTQLDLDVDDLGDTLLDQYLREGHDRTFAAEERWPFFESSWTLTVPAGLQSINLFGLSVNFLLSLRNSSNKELVQIPEQFGEDNFQGETGAVDEPLLFSVWANQLRFWPAITVSATDTTFSARGYRDPIWLSTPSAERDGDERLHSAIIWYACSLAYAQLEEVELEAQYLQRWTMVKEDIRRQVMQPRHHTPMILNGGVTRTKWSRLDLNLDGL